MGYTIKKKLFKKKKNIQKIILKICKLSFIYYLLYIIYKTKLESVEIHHPSSIIHHPSSIIHHPSSFILHPSSIICHPSSIISHLIDCLPLELGWISQSALISNYVDDRHYHGHSCRGISFGNSLIRNPSIPGLQNAFRSKLFC